MNKVIATLAGSLLLGSIAQAQIIYQEDFEGVGIPANWTVWQQGGTPLTLNFDEAAPANRPTQTPTTGNPSSGEVLLINLAGDFSNGGFYVAIDLEAGKSYAVDGATRSTNSPTSHWEEVFVSTVQPVDTVDVTPGATATLIGKNSSWPTPNWDNTLQTSQDFGGLRFYSATTTGTHYIVFKTGVCCGGGPATITLDEFSVEEVGEVPTYDAPPIPLFDDFEDVEPRNNYGGTYTTFAGGDPGGVFAGQDGKMSATILDGVGVGGSRAMNFKSSSNIEGLNFVYYGGFTNLHPNGGTPVDITGFNSLRFDARLGDSPGATLLWLIRLEDTTNAPLNNQWNYQLIGDTLTTSWQTYSIPLSDFADGNADGGLAAPNLQAVKSIVWVSIDGETSGSQNVDLLIDNVALSTDAEVPDWSLY